MIENRLRWRSWAQQWHALYKSTATFSANQESCMQKAFHRWTIRSFFLQLSCGLTHVTIFDLIDWNVTAPVSALSFSSMIALPNQKTSFAKITRRTREAYATIDYKVSKSINSMIKSKIQDASWALLIRLCIYTKICEPDSWRSTPLWWGIGSKWSKSTLQTAEVVSIFDQQQPNVLCMSGPMLLGDCNKIWTVAFCVIYRDLCISNIPNTWLHQQQHSFCGSRSKMPSRCWVSLEKTISWHLL